MGIPQLLEQQVGEFAEPQVHSTSETRSRGGSGKNRQKTSPERNGGDGQGSRQFHVKFACARCLYYTKTMDNVFQPADCGCL